MSKAKAHKNKENKHLDFRVVYTYILTLNRINLQLHSNTKQVVHEYTKTYKVEFLNP